MLNTSLGHNEQKALRLTFRDLFSRQRTSFHLMICPTGITVAVLKFLYFTPLKKLNL